MMAPDFKPQSCDIFCNVIDNYGDIGVCWRLARQLASEHGLQVRLWVDDLGSLAKLCPESVATAEKQNCRGVEVCLWSKGFPKVQPAELVIEAFACKLPSRYIATMAAQAKKPIWINLEYLSAEDWVESHHKLPSPHPALPLTKYFFFPGFTKQTGGLLLERDLLMRRDAFQNDAAQQQAFWKSIGIELPSAGSLKVSLFAYENSSLLNLFDAWSACVQPLLCLVPEGRILPQVGQYFGDAAPCAGKSYSRGNLHVCVLPFVEQERYDELLWACDVNFVRGEDSFVRAQWAGKPFVWQIYPQNDAVHLKKLQAFLILYCERLSPSAIEAVRRLSQGWNEGNAITKSWSAFVAVRGEVDSHAQHWAQQLAENNLALNLLDFCQEIGRMRALENEGQ
jgi:uncharacterized repeat protein (TIGR03837 family)